MFTPETRILVIDDMKVMRSLIKGQLRTLNYQNISEAENGEEAFKILEQNHSVNTPIQVVLSDWNMPVMSGLELLKKVREDARFKNLPFIMITAEGELEQVKSAAELGVSSYIRKPFAPNTFSEKLEQVYKKHCA